MADQVGLDPARFDTDYASPAAAAFVTNGISDAVQAGVESTPTLMVNGQPFTGSTYPDLSAAIAAAAAK
jgi:protein-disulfide isomerase